MARAVAAAGLPQEPAMPLAPKARIEIVGLQDRPELNLAKGTVVNFDSAMRRWKVKLDKGGMKMFREGNLRVLAEEMPDVDPPPPPASFEGSGVQEDSLNNLPTELFHKPKGSSPPPERSGPSTAASQEDVSLMNLPTNLFSESKRFLSPEQQHPPPTTAPSAAQRARSTPAAKQEHGNKGSLAVNGQEGMDSRISRIENQLSLLFTSLNEQQILLDDLVSKDTFDERAGQQELDRRIAELETFRAASEKKMGLLQASANSSRGSMAPSTFAGVEERLRKSDTSLRDLQHTVESLQECLDHANILPSASILPSLHRRRFAAVCAASDWAPSVGANDVFMKREPTLQMFGFVDKEDVRFVRQACKAARKVGVLGGLLSAQATAEREPRKVANWNKLRQAITSAEAAGVDEETLQVATDLVLRGQVWCLVQTGNSSEVLQEAIRAARQSDFDSSEVAEMEAKASARIAQLGEIAEAKRRLRIAVSWASANNIDKLKKAIAEAEELGVDPEEIVRAEKEVAGIIAKEAAKEAARGDVKVDSSQGGLLEVLRTAKPYWTQRDLDAARVKLAVLNIVTVPGLAAALEDESLENNLNERLRNAGQKAFTEDTVKAIRTAVEKTNL